MTNVLIFSVKVIIMMKIVIMMIMSILGNQISHSLSLYIYLGVGPHS